MSVISLIVCSAVVRWCLICLFCLMHCVMHCVIQTPRVCVDPQPLEHTPLLEVLVTPVAGYVY